MEKRHIALEDKPLGLLPEQALVLETIGSIENFIRAVERIPGLKIVFERQASSRTGGWSPSRASTSWAERR